MNIPLTEASVFSPSMNRVSERAARDHVLEIPLLNGAVVVSCF